MGWMDNLANTLSGRTDGSLTSTTNSVNEKYDQRLAILDSFVKQNTSNGSSAPEGSISEKMSPVGLDAIIQDWVRQQSSHRQRTLEEHLRGVDGKYWHHRKKSQISPVL